MSHSVTPWTIAHEAPLSMGLSRQESYSGLPCPLGDLPDPGIDPGLLHCRWILYCLSHRGSSIHDTPNKDHIERSQGREKEESPNAWHTPAERLREMALKSYMFLIPPFPWLWAFYFIPLSLSFLIREMWTIKYLLHRAVLSFQWDDELEFLAQRPKYRVLRRNINFIITPYQKFLKRIPFLPFYREVIR